MGGKCFFKDCRDLCSSESQSWSREELRTPGQVDTEAGLSQAVPMGKAPLQGAGGLDTAAKGKLQEQQVCPIAMDHHRPSLRSLQL